MLSRIVKLCIASVFAAGSVAYTTLCRLVGWPVPPTFVVLMYHSVKAGERERFSRQMGRLLETTCPVGADFTPAADGRGRRYVAVTFDDAYRSVLENAMPVLLQKGIPATIFVPTGYMGGRPGWVGDDNPRDRSETLLNADEIRGLHDLGVTIGSHSVSHRMLPTLNEADAVVELFESRQTLEGLLGTRVNLCALPYGAGSPGVLRLAGEAGYGRVFLGDPVRAPGQIDGLATGRIGVSPSDWRLEYELKIRGAYRWLPWAIDAKQAVLRRVRGPVASPTRPSEYSVQVDGITREEWYDIIRGFEDCNIYQTWSYESARPGRNELSHLVLRRGGDVVAAAQARIVRLPVVGWGAAYVRWGPLWKRRGETPDPQVFEQAVRALRLEYAGRRRLLLRVYPRLFQHDGSHYRAILETNGYRLRTDLPTETTLLVDLRAELEQLRKGLHQKWRADLNHAERNDLEIVDDDADSVWEEFARLHSEMIERKKFVETADLQHFRALQRDLPDDFRLKLMVARANGEAGAGLICSGLGNTGVYLFGATNRIGMGCKGSYALQWQTIAWLKKQGVDVYDLHGINPQANPGTYQFKARLCGKNGREAQFLGHFEVAGGMPSRWAVRGGEVLRTRLRRLWDRSSRF